MCILYCIHISPLFPFSMQVWWTILLIVEGFFIDVPPPQEKIVLFYLIHFGHLFGKFPICLIVKYMFVLSIVFVSHHYSHLTCRWWTISLIVDGLSLMMIEDDIECNDDDDDTLAFTVMMALTTSCIVMQKHMDKRKHRQKKKKG